MSELVPRPQAELMRASDADRERIAGALAEALATGRLNVEEYTERLDTALTARTVGELEPLVSDLPAARSRSAEVALAGQAADPRTVTRAVLSKVRRGAQAVVPAHSAAEARFGAVVLDLREAVFEQPEVTITATSFCGKIEILVPPNARVDDVGTAFCGKRTLPGSAPSGPGGPAIHIDGSSAFGHLKVIRDGDWNSRHYD